MQNKALDFLEAIKLNRAFGVVQNIEVFNLIQKIEKFNHLDDVIAYLTGYVLLMKYDSLAILKLYTDIEFNYNSNSQRLKAAQSVSFDENTTENQAILDFASTVKQYLQTQITSLNDFIQAQNEHQNKSVNIGDELKRQLIICDRYLQSYFGCLINGKLPVQPEDLTRLKEYTALLIEHNKIADPLISISNTGFSGHGVMHIFYLLHKELYGNQGINYNWPIFIINAFDCLKNNTTKTIRGKWSSQPKNLVLQQIDIN
jgi:hypothetical protein